MSHQSFLLFSEALKVQFINVLGEHYYMLKLTDVDLQAANSLDVFSVYFLSFSDLTLLMYNKLQLPFLLKYFKDVDIHRCCKSS